MPRNGESTRTAIMDSAEALILEIGFSATSIDRVVENAGVTKGTFFYHFRNKAELALALVERWARLDAEHLDANMARAEKLARDPLQQMLIFVALFEESAEAMTEASPGCLFGSYLYEAGLFDASTMAVIEDAMAEWKERLGAKLEEAARVHPPRVPSDPYRVAEMLTVLFEGAFIVAKTMRDPKLLAAQLAQYRTYLELLHGVAG